ncbi:MAG: class I SAM-dependent methyltransferase [Eubacteriales bacterium]|nr:class I SAM-dependent methyltransferase [Eubacteriales bacterium]
MNTDQASMTALVSAFSRWYHHEHAVQPIYDDTLAGALLSPDEKRAIAAQMSGGISFFCPGFQGSPKDALRRIVDGQLSPSPLGRAAFARRALRTAVTLGTRQFILLGAGYDTFAYRHRNRSICNAKFIG